MEFNLKNQMQHDHVTDNIKLFDGTNSRQVEARLLKIFNNLNVSKDTLLSPEEIESLMIETADNDPDNIIVCVITQVVPTMLSAWCNENYSEIIKELFERFPLETTLTCIRLVNDIKRFDGDLDKAIDEFSRFLVISYMGAKALCKVLNIDGLSDEKLSGAILTMLSMFVVSAAETIHIYDNK